MATINPYLQFCRNYNYQLPELISYVSATYPPDPTPLGTLLAGSIEEHSLVGRTEFAVAREQGRIGIPKMGVRGGAHKQHIPERTATKHYLEVPLYPFRDSLSSVDLLGKYELGTPQAQLASVGTATALKMQTCLQSFANLREYNLCMAVQGKVMNGLDLKHLDLFNLFNVQQKNIELELPKPEAEGDYPKSNFEKFLRHMTQAKSGIGATSTGFVAICSPGFYARIRMMAYVQKAFFLPNDTAFYRELGVPEGFDFMGITWLLYDRTTWHAGTEYAWIPDGEAFVIPQGISGLFQEVYAPGEYLECIASTAQKFYWKQWSWQDEKGMDMEGQTAQLIFPALPETITRFTIKDYTPLFSDWTTEPPSPIEPTRNITVPTGKGHGKVVA